MTAGPDVHVEVRGLTMAHGGHPIQEGLSFSVARGEIFVIMGDTGCGKTLLMRHMIGLDAPAAGDVFYAGQPLWAAEPAQREAL